MFPSGPSKFDQLPTRPPTPPKIVSEAIDDAIAFLDDSNEIDQALNRRTTHHSPSRTCRSSPAPSHATASTSNASKKVGFAVHTVKRSREGSSPTAPRTTLSPSSTNSKPSKSILKAANHALPPTPDSLGSKIGYFSPDIPGSFPTMLQSVVQQLASPSRTSRLDAYLALNGVLKAYDSMPDPQAMMQKMSLFMQFLARDIPWKDSDGKCDTNIITQALKLTSAILFHPTLAEALDDDFRTFLIDRSITALEQQDVPKAIVKAHMFIVVQQHFRPQILNAARADRLLTALKSIEQRCSGNNVVASRLVIYLRMIEQAPSVMLRRAAEWLEHVFHGMLSSIKDVRTRAIDTCTRAGRDLGQESHLSRAAHEIFETEVAEGQTYYDFLSYELIKMLSKEGPGPSVPRIWSAIILLFRSKRMPLIKWPRFKSSLLIVQKCLNSSDAVIRHEATLAWNKLVYVAMPDSTTTTALTSMLSVPIATALAKRGTDKTSHQARAHALESYYNLLYYAFRPGLLHGDYDIAWNMYVNPVLSDMAKSSGKGRRTCCRILHGLVNGKTGVWYANVALERISIKPEELPKLDSRWVRSHLEKFLKLLEPILADELWSPTETATAVDPTWYCVMRAVADAGGQEVKTSNDLKEAIASLVNFLRRLWDGCEAKHVASENGDWIKRYVALVDTVVSGLGPSPLIEEILAATEDDTVEVAPTPSQRPSKHRGSPQSPFDILIAQLLGAAPTLNASKDLLFAITTFLKRMRSTKSELVGKLALLDHTLQKCSAATAPPPTTTASEQIWTAVAGVAISDLKIDALLLKAEQSHSIGQILRHGVSILGAGLGSASAATTRLTADQLLDSLYDVAKTTAGDAGITLAVTEPFASILIKDIALVALNPRLHFADRLLQRAVWPKTLQQLEQARKLLWGVGLASHGAGTFKPFDHTCTLIEQMTISAYDEFDLSDPSCFDPIQQFFSSVCRFLDRSPVSLLGPAIHQVQKGVAVWIRDLSEKTDETKATRMVSTYQIIIADRS